jgi:hypothetical protein
MAVTDTPRETAIGDPTNDAARIIALGEPYTADITIEGTAALLLHRWSVDAIAEKAAAPKGSKAKKEDDLESYVYRCEDGTIGIPGEYLRAAICNPQGSAKFRQDPRSPRKSALDLYRAGLIVTTELATLGQTEWDYIDRRRVMVQRAGVSRWRPAFLPGWTAQFQILVTLPEYITPADLRDVLFKAGRMVGLGDFRPTFGRFDVTRFELQELT